jgi:nucleotide-binding universal stress UspA family protein
MANIKTILCPTDFSEPAQQAFRLACSVARDYGAKLILLHVKPRELVVGGVMAMPPEPLEIRADLQNQLDAIKPDDPQIAVERQFLVGDPAGEISRVAADKKCDLIVMGTHGRTGVRRLLMGSVAEQVLREAPCAVLTVRTQPPAK